MLNYKEFTSRNTGYLSPELQERLRKTSLLIAGCGVGSVFAEVAVRLGCENLTLVDGDTVARHNLNRQAYVDDNVGEHKVDSLAKRLQAINPEADIKKLSIFVDTNNVGDIVAGTDVVFDTIDFIDLSAIIALHDEAAQQKKPVIAAMNVGWGAGILYFPVGGTCSFRSLFDLPEVGPVDSYSYTEQFVHFAAKGSHFLPDEVKNVTKAGLQKMADGSPCPMSQVAVAAHCLAGLAGTVLVRLLAGLPIVAAPKVIYSDMGRLCAESDFTLTADSQ